MTVSITFSHDDIVSARWTGVGRPMTYQEINLDLFNIKTAVETLQANYTLTVSLSTITQPTESTLLFTLTDATTFGPFTIPVSTFQDRGDWATSTPYLVNDTFNAPDGGLYRVKFDHTSDATSFSPTANDGAGHDYYAPMIPPRGNTLPSGGATGQVMQKSSGTDYAVTWGYKLPIGGDAHQVLLKQSSTNQDADWTTLSALYVAFAPSTASGLVSTDMAAAIEEVALLANGAVALADLSDVTFPTGDPANGQLLSFNSTKWTSIPQSDLVLVPAQLRNNTVTALGTSGIVSLDPSLGDVFTITPNGNVTLNAASAPEGARITVIVETSGFVSYNITPGTNFKSTGVLATGTADSKTFTISFVGNGTKLVETSRTVAM